MIGLIRPDIRQRERVGIAGRGFGAAGEVVAIPLTPVHSIADTVLWARDRRLPRQGARGAPLACRFGGRRDHGRGTGQRASNRFSSFGHGHVLPCQPPHHQSCLSSGTGDQSDGNTRAAGAAASMSQNSRPAHQHPHHPLIAEPAPTSPAPHVPQRHRCIRMIGRPREPVLTAAFVPAKAPPRWNITEPPGNSFRAGAIGEKRIAEALQPPRSCAVPSDSPRWRSRLASPLCGWPGAYDSLRRRYSIGNDGLDSTSGSFLIGLLDDLLT